MQTSISSISLWLVQEALASATSALAAEGGATSTGASWPVLLVLPRRLRRALRLSARRRTAGLRVAGRWLDAGWTLGGRGRARDVPEADVCPQMRLSPGGCPRRVRAAAPRPTPPEGPVLPPGLQPSRALRRGQTRPRPGHCTSYRPGSRPFPAPRPTQTFLQNRYFPVDSHNCTN